MAGALEAACERWADRPALSWAGRSTSYGQLGDAAASLARTYRQAGVGKGDRVVCWLPNCPMHLVAALGAWWAGAIHVGVEADLAPPELAWRAGHVGAAVVMVPSGPDGEPAGGSRAGLEAVAESCPAAKVLALPAAPGASPGLPAGPDEGVDAGSAAELPPGPLPADPALIFFTSGTTAVPKGVVRYQRPLLWAWSGAGERLGAGPEDVHLTPLPLAHGFGFGRSIMALLTGGRLVLMERFSAEAALELITREGGTMVHGTPPHFALLVEGLDRSRHDVSSLRMGSGSAARFPPQLLARIFDDLGMDFHLAYGSSEGMGCATTDREDMLAGSVGRPRPDLVHIVDPEGVPLEAGQAGEIVLRRWSRFSYWGQPPAAPGADAGWYHSGDLGRIDEQGRLHVLGRLRHQVNRGGVRVDPGEVEEVIVRQLPVADAAVVGMPDPIVGEAVCACVVPLAGQPVEPGLGALRQALSPHLARHKLPEQLCRLDHIPRTGLGKVDRDALVALVAQTPGVERLREG